jgi:hypothetical protein
MLGVMFAALYGPALADTTVSSNTTTALKTSTSGNITVNQNVSVTVGATGAAVTIDSGTAAIPSSLSNGGIIQNIVTGGGGIAVELLPGNTGNFLNDGTQQGRLNVPNAGFNNIGLLLAPGGAFTGNITLGGGSTVTVIGPLAKGNATGPTAVGIEIQSILNGDLTVGSKVDARGEGTTGLVTSADINGLLDIGGGANGGIFAFGALNYTADKVDPTSGSAVLLGGNITKGLIIEAATQVVNRGSLADLRIAPSVASENGGIAHDIMLGDAPLVIGNQTIGSVNLSFINRGTILVNEGDPGDGSTDPGISTLGLLIGEQSGPAAHTVSLPGGFFNSGTIQATARTDNVFATGATIGPANATAIEIGSGVTILPFTRSNVTVGANIVDATGNVTLASTNQQVILDANASSLNNEYVGMNLTLYKLDGNGTVTGFESASITAYDGTTHLASIGTATFSATPSAGTRYSIQEVGDPTASTLPFVNVGLIKASTAATVGGKGGVATALMIDPGAHVAGIDNKGTIIGIADVVDTKITNPLAAYGIRDLSGTLNAIQNTGLIQASAATLDNNSQKVVAIDLSSGSASQNIVVTDGGTVIGDVKFGSHPTDNTGINTLIVDGNIRDSSGNITKTASVSGSVTGVGGGVPVIFISRTLNQGGQLQTQNVDANALQVGPAGVLALSITKNTDPATAEIRTLGSAGFDAGATLTVTPQTFLPLSSSTPSAYSLIHSAIGQANFSNANTANNISNSQQFPAILTGSVTCDGGTCADGANYHDVSLTVRRKSAAELGLTGNDAAIYEPLSIAALHDDVEGKTLMGFTNQSDLQTAINRTVPDVSGGMRALSIAMTDQATGVIGTRQRNLVTSTAGQRNEFRFWGQEFYNNVSMESTSLSPGFSGAGQGISVGVEWGALPTGRYGVGYTYFSSEETERHPRETKTNGDWNMVTAYAGWRGRGIFFAPQVNVGMGSFLSHRLVNTLTVPAPALIVANANWEGYLASGGSALGYIINFGSFQVVPEIALDAMYIHQGAYKETGASGTSLSLDPQNQQSVRAFAGVLAQGAFRWNDGNVQPQLLAGWSHEFMAGPATIDGSFESTPGSRFHLVGPTLDSDRAIGGASLSYVFSNWQAGVNLDATRGENTMTEAATISLSSRF